MREIATIIKELSNQNVSTINANSFPVVRVKKVATEISSMDSSGLIPVGRPGLVQMERLAPMLFPACP